MSGAVLLATVGERDPAVGGEPTGPLRASLTLRPSTIVLVHTERTRRNADEASSRIGAALDAVSIHQAQLEGDPSDRARVLEQCRALVERLRAAGVFRRGCAVEVCSTSGTPQMGDALTLAVAARYPRAKHWQALNPTQTGGPELLRPVRPDVLWILTHVADGLRLLRSGLPAEALGAMEREGELDLLGTSLPYVRVAVALARLLGQVAEYQLSEVRPSLHELRAATEAASRVGTPVDRLVAWYGRLVAEREQPPSASPAWPLELAATAAREFDGGRRMLGVLRLAAAAQVACAARLLGRHGIDSSNLGSSRETVVAALGEAAIHGPVRGRFYVAGWHAELQLLATLERGDLRRTLQRDDERSRQKDELARLRNELLHTGAGTTAEQLGAAFVQGRRFVDWLFSCFGWGRLDDVPSMPAGVRAAVDSLAEAARITLVQ